ncbi:PocR ligand-binding domain-containing protein [Anaeromicrobium sediminis]|nr:PocR ligand-binding domain-containing protein [Anaeromicrobium sediminis]
MIFDVHGNLDENILASILDTFYESTYISIKYINSSGKTILTRGNEKSFCSLFHEIITDSGVCEQTHLYTSRQAFNLGESFIFFCPAGLTEFSYPIIHEGVFSGALIGGPVLMNYPDEIMVDDILCKNHIHLKHKGKIHSHLRSIPVVDPKRVRFLSKLIEIIGKQITQENKQQLKEQHSKMLQQSRIGEMIHSIKSQDTLNSIYPYEKEKELLMRVKQGDINGAKVVLNELLGYVFYTTGVSIEVTKARSLEICSLISRAAVEGGAELSKIFSMNYQFIHELNSINNMDDLSYCILKVLNHFTESVIHLHESKNPVKFKEALTFINSHYMESISLEHVSNKIGLSPKYFSSLFKKEQGISFTKYVNKLRIDEAKRLLVLTNRTILDIGLTVGFEDVSYFSKVFKKITNLSPNQYRKLNA